MIDYRQLETINKFKDFIDLISNPKQVQVLLTQITDKIAELNGKLGVYNSLDAVNKKSAADSASIAQARATLDKDKEALKNAQDALAAAQLEHSQSVSSTTDQQANVQAELDAQTAILEAAKTAVAKDKAQLLQLRDSLNSKEEELKAKEKDLNDKSAKLKSIIG